MKYSKKINLIVVSIIFILLLSLTFFPGCSKKDNGTNPPTEKPEIVFSPDPMYFGQIPTGQFAERKMIISNIGGATLNISAISIEGADAGLFAFVDNVQQITLDPYSNTTLSLRFSPTATGSFSAQLKTVSNTGSSPDQAELTAKGSTASAAAIAFERIIGDVDADNAGSVQMTTDGGYIIAGSTTDQVNERSIASLVKTDQYGNILWSKRYSESGPSSFGRVLVTSDGGYLAVGNTQTSETSKRNIYLVKTDQAGQMIWQKDYSFGNNDDIIRSMKKTSDGGYILGGDTRNTSGSSVKDALLLKVSADGTEEWHHSYNTGAGEEANDVEQTNDGGFVFTGSLSVGVSDFNIYLVKTDATGTSVWEKTLGGTEWENSHGIIVTEDNQFLITGYTQSEGAGRRDVLLMETDSAGTVLWQKTYGGSGNDEGGKVIRTTDQGYLIVGYTESYGAGEEDLYVVKTDNQGNQSWYKTYGGVNDDGASFVCQTPDDGFIISGGTSSFSKDRDIYLLKVNSQGDVN
jgi:hypothetical protein